MHFILPPSLKLYNISFSNTACQLKTVVISSKKLHRCIYW